jgi:hypothetical protein
MTFRQMATKRVDGDKQLSEYRDIIIDADWSETDHYHWVATAPKTQVLDWAQVIRQGLEG